MRYLSQLALVLLGLVVSLLEFFVTWLLVDLICFARTSQAICQKDHIFESVK